MKTLSECIMEAFSKMPPYEISITTTSNSESTGELTMKLTSSNSDVKCSLKSDNGIFEFIIPLHISVRFWFQMWSARDDRWKKYGAAPIVKLPAKGDVSFVLIEPARKRSDFLVEPQDKKNNVLFKYQFNV